MLSLQRTTKKRGVIITNISESNRKINTNLDGNYKVYIIDEKNLMKETQHDPTSFTLKKHQIAYIVNI